MRAPADGRACCLRLVLSCLVLSCLVLSVLFVCGERVGVVCAGGVECGVRRTCRLRRGFVCAGFAWRGLSAAACIVNIVAGGAAVGGGKQGD